MTDRNAALRGEIRQWLDRFEGAVYDNRPVELTVNDCAGLALMIRKIQDEAAVALGYEPPGLPKLGRGWTP